MSLVVSMTTNYIHPRERSAEATWMSLFPSRGKRVIHVLRVGRKAELAAILRTIL